MDGSFRGQSRFQEHLARLRESVHGDPHFQLLMSKLESGHVIQGVTFAERDGRAWYVFSLARLGAGSSVSVPAGRLGVEGFLGRNGLGMESRADEQRRCLMRLQVAMGPLFQAVNTDAIGAALRGFAERCGAPASLAAARKAWPQVRTSGAVVEILVRALERAFDEEAARLAIELGYPLDDAVALLDGVLSGWIETI